MSCPYSDYIGPEREEVMDNKKDALFSIGNHIWKGGNMDNSKLVEVVERYYKNMSPFIREGEVGDALVEILRILKTLDVVVIDEMGSIYGRLFDLVNVAEHLRDEHRINEIQKVAMKICVRFTKYKLRAQKAEKELETWHRKFGTLASATKRRSILEKKLADIKGRAGHMEDFIFNFLYARKLSEIYRYKCKCIDGCGICDGTGYILNESGIALMDLTQAISKEILNETK